MTSFLDRLRGRQEPTIAHQPTASSIKASYGDGWLAAYQAGGIPISTLNQDHQAKAQRLLQAYRVGWFNKAERKISSDFASLAVSVAPEDNAGDNQTAVVEPDLMTPWDQLDPIGQFLRLMEKPNPYQTGRQLRQKTMIRLDMAGWAFWAVTEYMSNGLPAEDSLYGISPARLWPSYDKSGVLLGYVLDFNRDGGTATFEPNEIIPFSYGSADDDNIYGIGVVEAIWAQVPLTDLMAKHVADVLTTGGRLAGAMWPKNRALDEGEFEDAKRAWRSVASDPNAARRLLLFPEPMEWSAGASTPQEIGIPELATLNRDDILTSFPISPYQLGVPMPGGLNSAATREEDRRDYWEGTLHPRVEMFEETVQTYLMSKYEAVVGYTLDFEISEPNLDDASRLLEKVGALDALTSAGFDEDEAIAAVGLDHIKFIGKPEPPMPPPPMTAVVQDSSRRGVNDTVTQPVTQSTAPATAKSVISERDAALDPATQRARDRLTRFFNEQRQRVEQSWRKLPATKAERRAAYYATKANPDWWDADAEDELLTDTMRGIYIEVGRSGLQAVADTLGKVVGKGFVQSIYADLLTYGGQRIKDINERTLQSLVVQLAEGTRRGYSIDQLIQGVPDEGYAGVAGVTLDNGVGAFDDYRAEMIARTETMLSYNRATVDGYGEFGVTTLLAYDGDGDEECLERNGQEYLLEDALNIEDHPNGTLAWSPVVDKAEHDESKVDPTVALLVDTLREAIKAIGEPKPLYITTQAAKAPDVSVAPADVHVDVHVPEGPTPTVNVDAPIINVDAPIVNVAAAETPSVTVNVPEQAAPVVNVTPPDVFITNEAAQVNVTSPDVVVNVPEAEAPIINVNVPKAEPVVNVKAPVVNVAPADVVMPMELKVTSMPDRAHKVIRDADGKPTGSVETDL